MKKKSKYKSVEDKIEDNIDFFRSQVTEASDGQDEAQETED